MESLTGFGNGAHPFFPRVSVLRTLPWAGSQQAFSLQTMAMVNSWRHQPINGCAEGMPTCDADAV